jgi:hypothetical protein
MAYDLPEELRDDGSRELEAQAANLAAQAAAENLALEREHSESMQRETEIANEMDGPSVEQFATVPGFSQDVPIFSAFLLMMLMIDRAVLRAQMSMFQSFQGTQLKTLLALLVLHFNLKE